MKKFVTLCYFILIWVTASCKPVLEKSLLPYLAFTFGSSSTSLSALNYPNNPYTFTINNQINDIIPTFSGTLTDCVANPALPTGLSLETSTCRISGTPTVTQIATDYTITASNSTENTSTIISITINDNPPSALTYAGHPFTLTRGVAITTITPSYTGSLTSCVSSIPLPTGLILNNTNCSIAGTPTNLQSFTAYTITASNQYGSTSTTINITISDAPPSALSYVGSPFVFTVTSTITPISPTITGTPTSYSVSPALPTGLSFSSTTGQIAGTPTAITANSAYTVTATNSSGSTIFTLNITVNDKPLTGLNYSPSPFVFTVNNPITAINPTISGTPTSYSVAPALPTGLSINTTTGQLAGTPTVSAANATYTVTATNSGGSTTFGLIITVNDAAPSGLSYAGAPFVFTINNAITAVSPTISGTPTSYSVAPALPTGLSINTTTGQLAGTPTTLAANATYTVTATNSGGSTSFGLSITVNDTAPSALSYAGAPFVFTINNPITAVSPTITGTPTSYSVAPALPTGLSINSTTGQFAGTPTAIAANATYTVTATNSGGSTTYGLIITVNDTAPSALSYAGNPFVFNNNLAITAVNPTVTGTPTSYSVAPALPTGLSINSTTGQLAGTPTVTSSPTNYTVTATNSGGSTTFAISIAVDLKLPIRLYTFVGGSLLDHNSANLLTANGTPLNLIGKDGDNNGSYTFNGTSQYLSGDATGLPSGASNRTLCAWIKPTRIPATNGETYIIANYGNAAVGSSFGIYLYNNTGTNQIALTGYGDDFRVNYSLPLFTWSHICATYDGSNAELFVNGIFIGSAPKTFTTGNTFLTIGAQNTVAQFFHGKIDHVRIYDYVLTSSQMRYAARQIPTGLIAYYDFQGDISDVSGNGKHLAVNSGTSTQNKNYISGTAVKYASGQFSATSQAVTNVTDNFTIAAWAKWEDGLSFGNFFVNGTGGNPYGLGFHTGGAFTRNIRVFIGGSFTYITPQVPVGVWNHYILMRDAGVWKVYMNGVQVYTNPGFAPLIPSGNFQISSSLNQSVDEVRVYNRVLSAMEIQTLSGYHPMQTTAWNVSTALSNLKLHLQADSLSNLGNGAQIGTWLDNSGNDFDVTQAIVAQQPIFNTSGINGRPAVNFNSANMNLARSCNTVFNGNANTILGVINQTTTGGTFRGVFHHGRKLLYFDGTGQFSLFNEIDNAKKVGSADNFISLLTASANMMFSIQHNGASGSLFKNGSDVTVTNTPITNTATCTNQMTIGATFFEGTAAIENTMFGMIGELLYFNSSISAADRVILQCYFGAKYNIPLSHGCP